MDAPATKRFGFGANWVSFARHALSAERVARARSGFRVLLDGIELADRAFLDIGFGQGLSASLAAEAGARVTALDIDPECATAYGYTKALFPGLREPEILIGSILDPESVVRLRDKGPFDVVHSWGVLHHTGDLWRAVDIAASLVRPGGHLVIALYARHWTSPLWTAVKWTYVHAPRFVQRAMLLAFYPLVMLRVRQLGADPTAERGMEIRHDLADWVGGYPYEYASREEVDARLGACGLELLRFHPTAGYTGCHEYVYRRPAA
jgi:2-polyprenyl-6-hydroxyphenyl methylase/3-demethylubiquinone-9 3-methyltransferase